MLANGNYYEKGSAARVSAVFSVNDLGRYAVELENGTVHRGDLSHLKVSERLGNVERKITLDNGSMFTTLDMMLLTLCLKVSRKLMALFII